MSTPTVGIVLVSHSAELAAGAANLAGQVSGGIVIGAAWLAWRVPGEDEPDDVMRVARNQLVLELGGNHVVRWRGDLGKPADPLVAPRG